MNKNKFSKGFTLVELLVVIAIIGILSTMLLLQLNIARAKGRDSRRVTDINQIRSAVELYYDEKGTYPTGNDPFAGLAQYMQNGSVPKDPNGQNYGYGSTAGGMRYQLWAELERYNAVYFNSDSDINAQGWGPDGVNGVGGPGQTGREACTDAARDCIFDVGVR